MTREAFLAFPSLQNFEYFISFCFNLNGEEWFLAVSGEHESILLLKYSTEQRQQSRRRNFIKSNLCMKASLRENERSFYVDLEKIRALQGCEENFLKEKRSKPVKALTTFFMK